MYLAICPGIRELLRTWTGCVTTSAKSSPQSSSPPLPLLTTCTKVQKGQISLQTLLSKKYCMSSTFYIPWTLTNHVDINLFCLYSYSTSYIGPVGVLCFFLVATVINKVLMSPVVNFVFKRQEMEGNYRQGQMFDVRCEFQRHMYTVNRKIFTRILFFPLVPQSSVCRF